MMQSATNTSGTKLLGLMTGLVFGALLQRGQLAKQDVILRQLLLTDRRVITTMASAVAVGALGIHILARRGLIKKDVKPVKVGGIAGGATLFGAGLALVGYCPGTSVAAAGSGHKDAWAGVLGMLFGAGAYVALYPKLMPLINAGGDFGKLTLTSMLAAGEKPLGRKRPLRSLVSRSRISGA
jgi:uncharacterized membrane protein YedE/YeeE